MSKLAQSKPSKIAIYKRDGYKCQYCGSTRSLTLDHVLPKSKGGQDVWENLVTCCCSCNVKKSNTLLEQTGMKLRTRPRPPLNKIYNTVRLSSNEEWKKYSFVS